MNVSLSLKSKTNVIQIVSCHYKVPREETPYFDNLSYVTQI